MDKRIKGSFQPFIRSFFNPTYLLHNLYYVKLNIKKYHLLFF
jgi:hypothetical protein